MASLAKTLTNAPWTLHFVNRVTAKISRDLIFVLARRDSSSETEDVKVKYACDNLAKTVPDNFLKPSDTVSPCFYWRFWKSFADKDRKGDLGLLFQISTNVPSDFHAVLEAKIVRTLLDLTLAHVDKVTNLTGWRAWILTNVLFLPIFVFLEHVETQKEVICVIVPSDSSFLMELVWISTNVWTDLVRRMLSVWIRSAATNAAVRQKWNWEMLSTELTSAFEVNC